MESQTPPSCFEPRSAPQSTLEQLDTLQKRSLAGLNRPCRRCGDSKILVVGELPDGRDQLRLCDCGARRTLPIDEAMPIPGVDIQGLDDPAMSALPVSIAVAITLYVEHRIRPDDMLCAALAGDLDRATEHAETHKAGGALVLIWYWIGRHCPRQAHGSIANVASWIGGAR